MIELIQKLEEKKLWIQTHKKSGAGIIPQLLVLAVVIILLGVLPIVVYMFFNVATTVGGLSTNQKGNVSNIINNSVGALNLGSLLPLVIIIALIISVLLGVFAVGYLRRS